MSWTEKITTPCIITTGDGQVYFPLWKPTSKQQDYNLSEFEFPEVAGTKVDKQQPKGQRFNLLIYFQGDDHLDQAEAFRISANDKRPWDVSHPFFGDFVAQAVSLDFNQESLNVTEISGVLIETITDDFPQGVVDVTDQVATLSNETDTGIVTAFENNVEPEVEDIQTLQKNNLQTYTEASKFAPPDVAEEYFNLYKRANAAFSLAASDAGGAIAAANAVISAPGMFQISAFNRLDILKTNLDSLITQLGLTDSENGKRIFEANGAATVKTMAVASVNPLGEDYLNAVDILRAIDILMAAYNLFIDTLNEVQATNGGDEDAYIPDPDTIRNLSGIVKFSISQLYTLSFGALQERRFVLEDDSNPILLAHRLYGLDVDDVNITRFIAQNSIGMNELLGIRKGRDIVYYV